MSNTSLCDSCAMFRNHVRFKPPREGLGDTICAKRQAPTKGVVRPSGFEGDPRELCGCYERRKDGRD